MSAVTIGEFERNADEPGQTPTIWAHNVAAYLRWMLSIETSSTDLLTMYCLGSIINIATGESKEEFRIKWYRTGGEIKLVFVGRFPCRQIYQALLVLL